MAIDTSGFRNGLKLEIDGDPFVMTYFQHVKPGKGGAFVRTKLKNLKTGRVLDKTFRSGEKVQEALQNLPSRDAAIISLTFGMDSDPLSYRQVGASPRTSRSASRPRCSTRSTLRSDWPDFRW